MHKIWVNLIIFNIGPGPKFLLFGEQLNIDEADITEASREKENVEILRKLHWHIDREGISEGQGQAWEKDFRFFILCPFIIFFSPRIISILA